MLTAIPTKIKEKSERTTHVASLSKQQLFEILDDLYSQLNKINQKIEVVKTALDLKVFHNTPIPELVSNVCNSSSEVLNQNDIAVYKHKLIYAMEEEQLFLNTDLNLNNLASVLKLPIHKVSKLINQEFHQNFSEFVNSYRLQSFLQKVANEKTHKFTIFGLAHTSGFSSKTVFNTYFKKKMGKTPKQFLNQVNKKAMPV